MNEVVSIITPSFNRATLVTETADSILAQSYPHWEWMIVDDGSTDNSWEVLQGLAKRDGRIKIHKRDRGPKGACACRNIAVERSTGKYLIFLDTDDVMAPFCLEQRVKAMQQQPEMDFLIFSMLLFKKKLDDTNRLWNVDTGEDEVLRILRDDPICQGTGTLWKKKTFVEIGMWREDLKVWQDMELHIRAFLWPVAHAKRMDLPPDVYLRTSDDSLSRIGFHALPKFKSRIEVCLYACKIVIDKKLPEAYRENLRKMICDLFLGLMYQKHFGEALAFLKKTKPYHLLSKEERRLLKTYLLVRYLKLDKIRFLAHYFYVKAAGISPRTGSSVGTSSYTAQVFPASSFMAAV